MANTHNTLAEQLVAHDHVFMQHVADLEEWNEEAGFEWGVPTVIMGNVVTVIHPHTYPNAGRGVQGEHIHSTAIAVYQTDGSRVAFWCVDKDATNPEVGFNYRQTPAERAAGEE